jgi:Flp pilus assembly pilin Flp
MAELKRFLRGDDGLEMVEWAIVGALIVGGMAAIMVQVGAQVNLRLAQTLVAIVSG